MANPGKLIILDIEVPAAAGAPRIDMIPAELTAVKIASLRHVVSARSMEAVEGGGVIARCGLTGQLLIPKGAQPERLQLSSVGGRIGLGSGPAASGGQGAIVGLALPAGSLTASYTMVTAVAVDALDRAGNYITNLLSGFNGDDYINTLLRHYGAARPAPGPNDKFVTGASSNYTLTMDPPNTTWAIVIVDYNAQTQRISIAINQALTFTSAIDSATFNPPDTAYVEIGYHLSNLSLRNSKLGELYTFDDSLLRTPLGQAQLQTLMADMKAYYAIA